ncbi:LOW QUALITY PROTEIN: vinexin [Lagopus muta]|uniref:LOW QUALITY PROTEIN: vinexin n=1 Tax=Lagopus muta TaxID=64668 RepID=UPI00209F4C34|nr:LOW QUALITY PROTEIN: vinexin [Lagopus muta]
MSLRARNGAAAERGPMEGAVPPPGCAATWTEDGRRRERRWVKYDGIGPVDETGLPLASRSSVDRPRDWYRRMFQQIHGKLPEPEWDTPCCTADLQTSQPPPGSSCAAQRLGADPVGRRRWHRGAGQHLQLWSPARRRHGVGRWELTVGRPTAVWDPRTVTPHPLCSPPELRLRCSPSGGVTVLPCPTAPLRPAGGHQDAVLCGVTLGSGALALLFQVQLQRELEQLSAELDEDIRAMERLQRSPAARSARRASPTPTARLSVLSPHGLQGRPAVPTAQEGPGGSIEQSGRGESPPRPPALPIAVDLGTPAAPTRGAAQMAAARLKFDFCAESPRELSLRRGDVVLLHGAVDANWLRGEHGGRVGIFPRTYVEVLPHGEAPQPGTPAAAQGCATAVFSFHGELPVELSFRRGEQLSLLRRIDAHWYEAQPVGTGRRGLAPRCYLCVHREPGGGPTAPQPPAPQVGAKQGPADPAGRPALPSAPGSRPPRRPHCTEPLCGAPTSSPHPQEDQPRTPSPPPPPRLRDPMDPVSLGGADVPLWVRTPPALWLPCRHRVLYDYRPQNGDELELREGERVDVLQCCDDGWFVGVSQRTQQFGTFPGNYVAPL